MAGRRSREHNLRLLGRAVRELREQRGIGTDALAAASGIPAAEIEAIEAGRWDPGYRGLLRLAEGLGERPMVLLLLIEELDAQDSA